MSDSPKVPGGVHFEEGRVPSIPRPAATVLVVRDTTPGEARGIEVFCVRRHQGSAFMGGAVVFPGGKVDDADRDPRWSDLCDAIAERASAFSDDALEARAIAIAASRELLEEAGIAPTEADAKVLDALRAESEKGTPFRQLFEERGLRLWLGTLVPFARWVTPVAEPRRFDARFFIMPMRADQVGRHDEHETTESFWASPAEVLARFDRGEIQLFPPTTRSLEILRDAKSVSDAVSIADRQDLRPICPRFVPSDPPMLVLPGDPAHEERDSVVAGPSRFVLREARFVSENP